MDLFIIPLIQRSPVRFRAWSHTGVGDMDYDEACFMHLTPGVVLLKNLINMFMKYLYVHHVVK